MKKMPNTPRSRIKSALRQVWLRSRERAAALKRTGYRCEECGVKFGKKTGAKPEVHHKDGIDWDGIVDLIIERVLQHPDRLSPLCHDCHQKEHNETCSE